MFDTTRRFFDLPEDIVYLDGNSLGPLPHSAKARMKAAMGDEWGLQLIRAWNMSEWVSLPDRLGDRIAPLIGAPPGSVVVGDTLSIKVFQALAAALAMKPDRRKILSDTGNFPSDLYIAQGLARLIGKGHQLVLEKPETIEDAIDEDTAAVLLTHVDYATGRMHDIEKITRIAQERGAVTVWDLAHSAGALPVDLTACNADFAAGCTYKYLNGGPGAPAFIYVAPQWQEIAEPALSGWFGHMAPFEFDQKYRAAPGIQRMRIGTPAILQMAVLDAALDVWDGLSMETVRDRSIELSEAFVSGVEAACPELKLASPRNPEMRGSQVSFRFEQGYPFMQALIAKGVIGDFRAPDLMRFGFAPLYVSMSDVETAVDTIAAVYRDEEWKEVQYQNRSAVT